MSEQTLPTDVRYSLDWIEVGKHVVPLVRTWSQDRSKVERSKQYVYPPAVQDRRTWEDAGYFRPTRLRRAASSLITWEELIAIVRATALGEPTSLKLPPAARRPISPRVSYSVFSADPHKQRLYTFVSTYLIRKPHPSRGGGGEDLRSVAELSLRRGRLMARPDPPYCGPNYLAGRNCTWDRIDLQSRSSDGNGEIPPVLKQMLEPPADNKVVAYIHRTSIHHIEALPLCDHISIEHCGSASLDELHLATRAQSIWINGGTIEAKHIDCFRSVSNLREIATFQTIITDGALRRLKSWPDGIKLSLDFAFLGNDSPALLAKIPGLESVSFYSHRVQNLHIRKLTRCQTLRNLAIVRSPLIRFGVKLLPQLPSLECLRLEDCRLTPRAIDILGHCQGLKELHLNSAALTDEHCPQLAALPKLERLSIKGTRVTDRGLGLLAKCTTLKVLAISGCRRITRAAIERFSEQRPDVKLIAAGMC
jgi:hypothetical protein